MTIDEQRALRILDAIEETGRSVRVALQLPIRPHHGKVREFMMQGTIGKVTSVHFGGCSTPNMAQTTSAAGTGKSATVAACWYTNLPTISI